MTTAFHYMISSMCGLGNPLTPRTPESLGGKLAALICASWQIAIGGTVISLTSAIPILGRWLAELEAWCDRRV